jgi:hypothetical protein
MYNKAGILPFHERNELMFTIDSTITFATTVGEATRRAGLPLYSIGASARFIAYNLFFLEWQRAFWRADVSAACLTDVATKI